MNKTILTLITSLGLLTFSYGQSIPTNSGGSITIANMGGFNGTYTNRNTTTNSISPVDLGYPAGTKVTVFSQGSLDRVVIFAWDGDGQNLLRARVMAGGVNVHQIAFNKDGTISTNPAYIAGDYYNIQNGTLNNWMMTWPEGGTGPGYEAMLNAAAQNEAAANEARLKALENAKDLTEGLTFENGQWSPKL
jgi:hypothetical protein